MKISIFGMGYVGVVAGACLAKEGHDVIGVDVNPTKVDLLGRGISPIVEEGIAELVRDMVASGRLRASTATAEAVAATDLSLVCVGTPSAENGSLSLAAMDGVSGEIGDALRGKRGTHTVVYRSTILPGTTEDRLVPILERHSGRKAGKDLLVGYNPEFLREGTSIRDFREPPMTVVGARDEEVFRQMETVYAGVKAEFVRTTVKLAESVKYLSNNYHALKIAFANEAGAILKAAGVDGREAMQIFCKDRLLNISPAYLRPGFAFGGSCLPKDLRAFLYWARTMDLDVPLLARVLESNDRHIERAHRMIARHGRPRVALFGLAFKGGTDDLRESPIVTLAERLLGRGHEMAIYDPNVNTSRLVGANKAFIEKEIPHLDRLLKTDPRQALEGAGVVVVANADRAGIDTIVAAKPAVPIIDLQGVREIAALPGAQYTGICW
ncbi:MAG: nucleotide sugar dehydrogenase [Planctomycetota bacterium]